MATKLTASINRLFKNVFVCKNCGQKMRTEPIRVVSKKVSCRRCGGKNFRAVKSKKK